MKIRLFAVLSALNFLVIATATRAENTAPAPKTNTVTETPEANGIKDQLGDIMRLIGMKYRGGFRTEDTLATNIASLDALFEKHKNEKTDDVAEILMDKARIYMGMFHKPDKAAAIITQIKNDFPNTTQGKHADNILAQINRTAEANKLQDSLAIGKVFPDFSESDITGKPLSVANYKGKVVFVEFWSTSCAICKQEMPMVSKVYEKYHDKGFEIIGVSLDKDKAVLKRYLDENKMTWPEYCDGDSWDGKLAKKYGIVKTPTTFLVDAGGKIAERGVHGPALDEAVSHALDQK